MGNDEPYSQKAACKKPSPRRARTRITSTEAVLAHAAERASVVNLEAVSCFSSRCVLEMLLHCFRQQEISPQSGTSYNICFFSM